MQLIREECVIMHNWAVLFVMGFLVLTAAVTGQAAEEGWQVLLGDEGLDAWREPLGDWQMVGEVFVDPEEEKRLASNPGAGIALNGERGRTVHLVSRHEHGDIEARIEFMVPRGSNSGVYFQGRYEIQILDSWGVTELGHGDCGGIYQRWHEGRDIPNEERGFEGRPPRVNASKAPGEWQRFDVLFRAPRFDADGSKTANAMFLRVKHNGILIHENQEVTGPTRSALFKDEQAFGPIMIQGDHGPVALRNIMIRLLPDDPGDKNETNLEGTTP
jgi:hypothetical protein